MAAWVYLIRNGDLHKIGITENFQQRMKQLKPDQIVAKLKSENYRSIEKYLHKEC